MDVFIIEKTLGNAYTTYKDVNGVSTQVTIGNTRIGPFDNIPQAADWLSSNSHNHASYFIEYQRKP